MARSAHLWFRTLYRWSAHFSTRNIFRFGRFLGWMWYYLIPIRRRTALGNVKCAFPGRAAEAREIVRRSFVSMCTNLLEFARDSAGAQIRLDDIAMEGMNHYEDALRLGRGVIVVTAHLGNFDLLASIQAKNGVPLGIVSKRLHNAGANELWMSARRDSGVRIFEEGRQNKSILKWLRDGKVLGLVVDQRLSERRGGIPVPFFGYDVWTDAAAAKLHLRTEAPILPVFIYRDTDGRHRMIVEPALTNENVREPRTESEWMLAVHARLESWITAHPEQWMWIHRRFRNSRRSEFSKV